MRKNEIPKEWKDLHDDKRAPSGHIFLARGAHVWGIGITRAEALRKARSLASGKEKNTCYAQCLPDDVRVSDIDGYAMWDDDRHDAANCEHCETIEKIEKGGV